MIQVTSGTCLTSALLLLILPLDWLVAVAIAALFHELCHIFMLYSLGGRIRNIQVHAFGCMIETSVLEGWRQFFSILAGPVGSFALLSLCHIAPKIAICGLFQGFYNLIPVLPLDGGRLLRLLLYSFCPKYADMLMDCIAVVSCIILASLAIWLKEITSFGPGLLILSLVLNIKLLKRKNPCKQSEIGVQ